MTSPEPTEEAIPAGLTTLRKWAARQGREHEYVRINWRKRPGFPEPVQTLPPRGRHGGGRGEQLFDESALDGWLAAQEDLRPPERIELSALGVEADDRLPLHRIAERMGKARKTVSQHRGRPGFPEPGEDGLYRVGDVLDYWNARRGRRGKARKRAADDE